MSTKISGKELVIVSGTASPDTTAQTPGMIRNPGIDSNTAGAKKIWLGKVDCTPNTMGPPHHHGEAETAAYVVKDTSASTTAKTTKSMSKLGLENLSSCRPISTTLKAIPTTSPQKRSCRAARTTS